MRLYVLTLNFWDSEEKHTMNTTEVYSTYELCKLALANAQDEYGENVDYSISFCKLRDTVE